MVQAVLTQKNANYIAETSVNTPPSEWTSTSTSYVEVTDFEITGPIPDKTWCIVAVNVWGANYSNQYSSWQLRDSTGTIIYGTFTYESDVYSTISFPSFYNNTGSPITSLKLYGKSPNATRTIKCQSPQKYYYATYNATQDINGIKWMVNNMYLLGGQSFGATGDKTTPANIELKSIVSDIVFATNSKEYLWDWAGYFVGVEP